MKTKPNRLFYGLVVVSLGIHLVIFMHISGIYKSNTLSYIELTIQDLSKPAVRNIPRPRHRPMALQPREIKERMKVIQRQMPCFKPITIEPVQKEFPHSLVEDISVLDIPAAAGLDNIDWNSEQAETSGSYLEMVRLRIEKYKKYPDRARSRNAEGSVTVRFVITPEGDIRAVEVVKASRHKILDTAALRAIRDAAPFPRPPRRFFKGEIPLEITILFELT
ncbi:MAG: energy transducer TonB [Desulfobacteraceae bacterium]|nr:energy transducer TonB [Pseudomonadota bacterium]MBU4463589.1 energy transducer TonB [Pseudomonadota bacterium]MCG2755217.1 energy transducer TonB [Desulfobacteraceae bacterium]